MRTNLPCLIACLLTIPSVTALGDDNVQPYVSVSGTAITNVAPDIIVWRISIRSEDKDLTKALADNNLKHKNVLSLREPLDIDPEDMKTGNLSIRREYERDDRGQITGFRHFAVHRNVIIRQRDLDRYHEFLTTLVARAEIEVSHNMESSRIHEIRFDTRLEAIRIARKKAVALAEALDSEVGHVLSIDEHLPGSSGMYRSSNRFTNVEAFSSGAVMADQSAGPFSPENIEEQVTVYVTFALKEPS